MDGTISRSFYSYKIIGDYPEYKNFYYKFDYITVITLFTAICLIPSFGITVKMYHFFHTNQRKIKNLGLHVFKAFLLSQLWNCIYVFSDFATIRIPSTSFFTNYCAFLPENNILHYVFGAHFSAYYISQFYTLLFCIVRVLILYSPRDHERLCEITMKICSPLSLILGILIIIPFALSTGYCVQLDEPFQFGAAIISSTFLHNNKIPNVTHLVLSTSLMIMILILNIYMLIRIKLNSKNRIPSNINSKRLSKVEKTLTVTMLLILVPLIVSLAMRGSDLLRSPIYPYIMIIRPFFIDFRVNVISWYFYLTHPVFNKDDGSRNATNLQKSQIGSVIQT